MLKARHHDLLRVAVAWPFWWQCATSQALHPRPGNHMTQAHHQGVEPWLCGAQFTCALQYGPISGPNAYGASHSHPGAVISPHCSVQVNCAPHKQGSTPWWCSWAIWLPGGRGRACCVAPCRVHLQTLPHTAVGSTPCRQACSTKTWPLNHPTASN